MATMKRNKTKYPGVFYRVSGDKRERVYYIRYRKDGRLIEEKAGYQYRDDMTPARASGVRARRIAGKESSNEEKRLRATRKPWTIDRLWQAYQKYLGGHASLKSDIGRYNRYLSGLGSKEPRGLVKLDTDRLRVQLLKKLKPQTVKHVLVLLKRICNYGYKQGWIPPLHFSIEMPKVDNIVTEDLTQEQLQALLSVLDRTHHTVAAGMMKLALFTGMRRGEMFKLKWQDIDFDRGFITLREPKGGKDQTIPMNSGARGLLSSMVRSSEYVFSGKDGGPRKDISKATRGIRDAAGLPSTFRPLHGLRHFYATSLAASGKVDMYTLQRLLTHKSPDMTMRYAHLRDDALRQASEGVVSILTGLTGTDDEG